MDMMAAEEARVSVDVQHEDKIHMIHVDGGLEAISDPENKFQKAIAVWRGSSTSIFWLRRRRPNALAGIDLSTLLSKLDATASEVVAHQRDSLVQRKDLAQKTKDFRKLDDAGKLGEYKGLLKGIDGPVRIFGLD
jgi:homeobox protein cut-like